MNSAGSPAIQSKLGPGQDTILNIEKSRLKIICYALQGFFFSLSLFFPPKLKAKEWALGTAHYNCGNWQVCLKTSLYILVDYLIYFFKAVSQRKQYMCVHVHLQHIWNGDTEALNLGAFNSK